MAIDSRTVRRLAALARLDIPEESVALRANELTALVASLGPLETIDAVAANEPISSPRRADRTVESRSESFTPLDGPLAPSGALIVPLIKKPN